MSQHGQALRASTVLHISSLDPAARWRLITTWLPRLCAPESAARRWYFVDVPLSRTGVLTTGLEVALLHRPDDHSVRADIEAWLADCRAGGLHLEPTWPAGSLVVDERLFLGGRVPAVFPTALALGSVRAARIMGRLDAVHASEEEVIAEIGALFTAFVPRRAERGRAVELYVTWLERVAAGELESHVVSRCGSTVQVAVPSVPEYVLLRRQLRRQTGEAVIRDSVVARLAHTQAVRLRGPEFPGGLEREATLARALLTTSLEGLLATGSSKKAMGT
jgi:hypothetical protein